MTIVAITGDGIRLSASLSPVGIQTVKVPGTGYTLDKSSNSIRIHSARGSWCGRPPHCLSRPHQFAGSYAEQESAVFNVKAHFVPQKVLCSATPATRRKALFVSVFFKSSLVLMKCCIHDLSQHTAEYQLMNRIQPIPISKTGNPHGIKDCRLANR
jgi:hypothetical protein